jgi:hypothetical protein
MAELFVRLLEHSRLYFSGRDGLSFLDRKPEAASMHEV